MNSFYYGDGPFPLSFLPVRYGFFLHGKCVRVVDLLRDASLALNDLHDSPLPPRMLVEPVERTFADFYLPGDVQNWQKSIYVLGTWMMPYLHIVSSHYRLSHIGTKGKTAKVVQFVDRVSGAMCAIQ